MPECPKEKAKEQRNNVTSTKPTKCNHDCKYIFNPQSAENSN